MMNKKVYKSLDDYKILKRECEDQGIEFMSTPFDLKSLECLHEIGMYYYKIPSGELTNLPLIREIAKVAKKVILSTGMSNLDEISETIDILVSGGVSKKSISVLHCHRHVRCRH